MYLGTLNQTHFDDSDFKKVDVSDKKLKATVKPCPKNWPPESVQNWLDEKKVSLSLNKNFRDVNGSELYDVYRVYIKAPEFFYKK